MAAFDADTLGELAIELDKFYCDIDPYGYFDAFDTMEPGCEDGINSSLEILSDEHGVQEVIEELHEFINECNLSDEDMAIAKDLIFKLSGHDLTESVDSDKNIPVQLGKITMKRMPEGYVCACGCGTELTDRCIGIENVFDPDYESMVMFIPEHWAFVEDMPYEEIVKKYKPSSLKESLIAENKKIYYHRNIPGYNDKGLHVPDKDIYVDSKSNVEFARELDYIEHNADSRHTEWRGAYLVTTYTMPDGKIVEYTEDGDYMIPYSIEYLG